MSTSGWTVGGLSTIIPGMSRSVRIALSLLAASSGLHAQTGALAGLDTYVARSLAPWKVAGLAIAVVKDDSVVFARGYGVREAGRPERVDPSTVFSIGSMTKFFTAVAAGMMVDAGKMEWDGPLERYLPEFQTGDPYVTHHLTLRDALSHRTGLDWRLDFLWFHSGLDRRQVLARLRSFVPDPGFRNGYAYSNVMFSAAGEAAAHAAGTTWEELIRKRIFAPLGMTSSFASFSDLPAGGNLAVPHVNLHGAAVPIRRVPIVNIPAAGAINSSALDMARWLRFILAGGRAGGARLIEPKTLAEILSPQVLVGPPEPLLGRFVNWTLYGLGDEILDYKGHQLVKHGGRVDGMLSEFALVPDRKLGVVVLTNTSGAAGLPPELPEALVYRVIDQYLGGARPDWSGELLAERKAVLARRSAAAGDSATGGRAQPALPLAAYAGRYAGPFGTAPLSGEDLAAFEREGPFATVTMRGGALELEVGPIEGRLQPWGRNTFRIYWDMFGWLTVEFLPDAAGKVGRMRVALAGEYQRADPPGGN